MNSGRKMKGRGLRGAGSICVMTVCGLGSALIKMTGT